MHNANSVYQQWQFNDLTQPSQPDLSGVLKKGKRKPKKSPYDGKKRENNHQTSQGTWESYVNLQSLYLQHQPNQPILENSRTSKQASTSKRKLACKTKRNAMPMLKVSSCNKNSGVSRVSCDDKNGAAATTLSDKPDESILSPDQKRPNNYGKIKIVISRPFTNSQTVRRPKMIEDVIKIPITPVKRKRFCLKDPDTTCLDPFAFVTITDQINFLTPQEACFKVPQEFSLVRKQISLFESKWAHRKEEFDG